MLLVIGAVLAGGGAGLAAGFRQLAHERADRDADGAGGSATRTAAGVSPLEKASRKRDGLAAAEEGGGEEEMDERGASSRAVGPRGGGRRAAKAKKYSAVGAKAEELEKVASAGGDWD